MAADLHIHVFTDDMTERDLSMEFSTSIGSKWCDEDAIFSGRNELFTQEERDAASRKVESTPAIWVGEVSWLKAVFLENNEKYVPATVQRVSEIIGEDLPVIDDVMIAAIRAAFKLPNVTGYRLAKVGAVVKFLKMYKGQRVFTVSW